MAITTYLNPMVCVDFTEAFDSASAAGALTRRTDGTPYLYDYFGSRRFTVGQFDMTSEVGGAHFRSVADVALGDGYDGWMEDFGEYTPLDAFGADGSTGTAGHNGYARAYHRQAAAAAAPDGRPLIRFSRSGWTGSAAYSPIVWGGDPSTTWDFDGLRSAVTNGLTMGLSGVGVWGSDIGGYFTLTGPALTPELLARWIEFGAFSGVMRLQGNGFGGSGRPQVFDGPVGPLWRRYAKLRTQLSPYVEVAADHYRSTGMPIMRHMMLVAPDDTVARHDDQYLFGDSLLVAPVLDEGAVTRDVALPSGRWFDLTEGLAYEEATGAFSIGDAPVVEGGGTRQRTATLEEVPLYAKAGTILSLLPADVDSLADRYASGSAVTPSERRGLRRLLAFPDGTSDSEIEPGEWARSAVDPDGTWTLTLEGVPTERTYDIGASMRAIGRGAPCEVTIDGADVNGWSWDPDTEVLTLSTRLGRGPLVVTPCSAVATTTSTSTTTSTVTSTSTAMTTTTRRSSTSTVTQPPPLVPAAPPADERRGRPTYTG